MSLLHRYILREFLPPLLVGLLAFTFILMLNQIFLIMDLFLNRGVDPATILKMSALFLPMLLPISVPMACLLAAMISYGRLSEEGELTALRSGGCSLAQYCLPSAFLGLLLSLFLVQFNLNIAPRANSQFKEIYHSVAAQNPLALFAPHVINYFGEYKVYVQDMDRRKKKLTGISIYRTNPAGPDTEILAPEGELNYRPEDGLTLELSNGAVHQPNPSKESEYSITKFTRFAIRIPAQGVTEKAALTPRELTWGELKAKIEDLEKQKSNASPWITEIDVRTAIAFAPLVFVFLGMGLGIRFKKGSVSMGVGLSLIVILIYYGLFLLMISLSSQGFLSPMLLTWTPNLIAMSAGGALLRRLASQ